MNDNQKSKDPGIRATNFQTLILAVPLIGSVILWGSSSWKLPDQMANMQAEVSAVQVELSDIKSNQENFQQKTDRIEQDVKEMRSQISRIDKNVTKIAAVNGVNIDAERYNIFGETNRTMRWFYTTNGLADSQ